MPLETRSQTRGKSSGTRSSGSNRAAVLPPPPKRKTRANRPPPEEKSESISSRKQTRLKTCKRPTAQKRHSPEPADSLADHQDHEAPPGEDPAASRSPQPSPEDDAVPPPDVLSEPTPNDSPSSKLEALRIIREYALTQEGEVFEITDRVQQVLREDFTMMWCSIIDAAAREDPDEDGSTTLARAHDKALQVLSLSDFELSLLSPDPTSFPSRSSAPPSRVMGSSPIRHEDHDPVGPKTVSGDDKGKESSLSPQDRTIEGDSHVIDEASSVLNARQRPRRTNQAGSYVYERVEGVESDSGEDDDFEKTEREKWKKENRKRVSRGLSPLPPFGEEDDGEEDEGEEENDDTDPLMCSNKRHYGNPRPHNSEPSRKSKTFPNQNATANTEEKDDEVDLSDLDDDSNGKPGPVDADVRAEAQRNYEEYEGKQRALALKSGKPLSAIFRAAGDSRKLLRGWNLWNVWQKWLVHEEGGKKEGEMPKEGEQQIAWMQRWWEEKRREVLGGDWQDKKKVQESFQWLIDWYEPLYQANALPVIQKGLSKRQIQSIAEDFNSNCRHANRNVGVCCFGFIVDLHGEHSVMFGAGQEFEDMRARSQTQLNQYLTDVVALFRVSDINLRLGSLVDSDHRTLVQTAAQIPLESNKDAHRRFIPYVLRYDLSRIDSSYNWKSGKFIWREFADLAWKHRVRLVNWHCDVGVPGTTLQNLKTNIPAKVLYEIGGARLQELQRHAESYEEGKNEEEIIVKLNKKALRLVEWNEVSLSRFSSFSGKGACRRGPG
ncbi:hypothetical protein K435DRAFT_792153 [Dendrothele bispora CBS 962.96]|uniref:Uncharacterized protein n=1 Tax=Dendrothele bispora (strain CBS 962.96) TaxID=1314807 RepID=A0A4S8MKC2_DENBC|nr:hypothetical protein K435DRAFT_792153 [Dendrothele bispora CBS 962.96]